jgi:hypothetical protein
LKVKLLLDSGKPKVPPAELKKVVKEAGLQTASGRADFGLVVGGDGRFGRYGRTENIPLLFVGVRSKGAVGSKAYLAEVDYDELGGALARIRSGDYRVIEHKRLAVLKDGRSTGEVFTDVYLQRGNEAGALRYRVRVDGPGVKFEEAAISDGVVVTTRAGSTGYYSYIDRIKAESLDPSAFAYVGADEVGVCHITPTYTERLGSGTHPLRYRVPWGSRIDISLFREAEARLYGVTDNTAGIGVSLGEKVTIVPGKKVTKTISLR